MATMRGRLPRWLGPGLAADRRADGGPHHPRDAAEYTELLCRIHPVGTPEHCRDTLAAAARRTGIDHVIVLVEGAGNHTAPWRTSPGWAPRSFLTCDTAPHHCGGKTSHRMPG